MSKWCILEVQLALTKKYEQSASDFSLYIVLYGVSFNMKKFVKIVIHEVHFFKMFHIERVYFEGAISQKFKH